MGIATNVLKLRFELNFSKFSNQFKNRKSLEYSTDIDQLYYIILIINFKIYTVIQNASLTKMEVYEWPPQKKAI